MHSVSRVFLHTLVTIYSAGAEAFKCSIRSRRALFIDCALTHSTIHSPRPTAFCVRVRVFDSTTNNLVVIVVLIAFVTDELLHSAAAVRSIHFKLAFFPTRRLSCEHSVALRLWMIHLVAGRRRTTNSV